MNMKKRCIIEKMAEPYLQNKSQRLTRDCHTHQRGVGEACPYPWGVGEVSFPEGAVSFRGVVEGMVVSSQEVAEGHPILVGVADECPGVEYL